MVKFMSILYVVIIFFNPISVYIPYSNYLDEFLCITLLLMALSKLFIKNDKVRMNEKFQIFILIVLISAIGFISNIVYGYMNSYSVIARDFLQTFKFFITFLSATYLFTNNKNTKLKRSLIKISKIIITVFFTFGVLSVFLDLGMGDSVRYGIKCYKFLYTHYTYLVFNIVLLISVIMCENEKNVIYYIMSFSTLLLTWRTKAFIFIAVVLLVNLIFYLQRNREKIRFENFIKLRYIIPAVLVVTILVRTKVLEYMSWGVENSIRVGMHFIGARMSLAHFPLGTGFGTYGTNISYSNYSPLYSSTIYGTMNYKHLLDYGYATISDVYWPSIYVQFGIIGCILFIIALICVIKSIFKNDSCDVRIKKAALCIVFYMILASISEATFSNESGVFAPIVMAMMMSFTSAFKYSNGREGFYAISSSRK